MKRGGRCGGETGSSTRTPVTQGRLFSLTFFSSVFFFVATDGKERALKIPPSFLPVSVSSPVVAIATEPHLHTELIQLVVESVRARARVLLVPLCVCVSVCVVLRLFNTRNVSKVYFWSLWRTGGWEECWLVYLESLESGTVMLLASLEACAAVRRTDRSSSQWQPGLCSGGGASRPQHQQPGEVVIGLWCR